MNTKYSRVKVGKIGEQVLLGVAAVGVVSIAILAPNMLQILRPFLKDKKYSSKQAVERNIDSLVRGGLLRKVKDAHGEIKLELTKRGLWESVLRKGNNELAQKPKWDGMWRVVIFDVPNSKSTIRGELRRGIKLYGFHQLQRSVWIYPYPCNDFVKLLRTHLDIAEDVVVMEVSRIEHDRELKRHFSLK